jgi:hypothetical protein
MSTPVFTRRMALKALGATALLPWLSDAGLEAYAAIQKTRAAPRLKVLTLPQYATVETLVEAIIPADERSPGAKEARVADYIDLLLAEAGAPLRDTWLAGLAALDKEAAARFGSPFVKLNEEQATALLTEISAFETVKKPKADPALDIPRNEQPKPQPLQVDTLLGDVRRHPADRAPLEVFFANTKQATIHGYYTSEIGIHQELKYKGNQILAEFVGCLTEDGKDCPHCGRKAKA